MRHPCHAKRCSTEIPPKLLMCPKHWRMVPANLKAEIWKTYVPGQEIRKDPTERYMRVQEACVRAVAIAEGLVDAKTGAEQLPLLLSEKKP